MTMRIWEIGTLNHTLREKYQYGPEKTPYLDTSQSVIVIRKFSYNYN